MEQNNNSLIFMGLLILGVTVFIGLGLVGTQIKYGLQRYGCLQAHMSAGDCAAWDQTWNKLAD